MIPTDPDLGPIERSDIVKGYEYEKGEYIVVTQDEIDSVRLESTRTIDIERFVPASEIDRLYWDNPYFLVPDGKLAAEAYGVIREAMTKEGQVALGRVVMHQRERLLAIEPRDNGMVAWSLRNRREVREAATYFDAIPDKKPDAAMIQIAQKIIEQKEGPFDPEQFNDRYEDALRALIKEKQKGKGRKVSGRGARGHQCGGPDGGVAQQPGQGAGEGQGGGQESPGAQGGPEEESQLRPPPFSSEESGAQSKQPRHPALARAEHGSGCGSSPGSDGLRTLSQLLDRRRQVPLAVRIGVPGVEVLHQPRNGPDVEPRRIQPLANLGPGHRP
jgi:Ku protein